MTAAVLGRLTAAVYGGSWCLPWRYPSFQTGAVSSVPGARLSWPDLMNDELDVAVFHGNWSPNEVNLHGFGFGGHVRWEFIDPRTGTPGASSYGDCTNE
jgi:hypothetical protein